MEEHWLLARQAHCFPGNHLEQTLSEKHQERRILLPEKRQKRGRKTDRPKSAIICYSFFRFLNSDEWFKIWLLILCRAVEWAPRDAGLRDWSGHRAPDRTRDSFPGRSWMKPALETDVWMPDSRTGHFQLFYFAAFIAVLGIGGNIAIRHLWTSLVSTANLF